MKLDYFLDRYFYKETLQYILEDNGYNKKGLKDELIVRIINYLAFTLDEYLEYLDKEDLKDICRDYNLRVGGNRDDLIDRIKTEITLENPNKSVVAEDNDSKQQLNGYFFIVKNLLKVPGFHFDPAQVGNLFEDYKEFRESLSDNTKSVLSNIPIRQKHIIYDQAYFARRGYIPRDNLESLQRDIEDCLQSLTNGKRLTQDNVSRTFETPRPGMEHPMQDLIGLKREPPKEPFESPFNYKDDIKAEGPSHNEGKKSFVVTMLPVRKKREENGSEIRRTPDKDGRKTVNNENTKRQQQKSREKKKGKGKNNTISKSAKLKKRTEKTRVLELSLLAGAGIAFLGGTIGYIVGCIIKEYDAELLRNIGGLIGFLLGSIPAYIKFK